MKHILRKKVAQLKNAYSDTDFRSFSEEIFRKLEQTESFKASKCILAYYSFHGEVFTHDFIERYANEKTIVLPVVEKDRLVLRKYNGVNAMKMSSFGILEPEGEEFTDFEQIDLVIVPGMVFDRNMNRIGRGKGYYDKLLPSLQAYLVGVCYSFQLHDEIPSESHDFPMNCIISQDEIIV